MRPMTAWQLKKLSQFNGPTGPVITCVMDGVGLGKQDESDAVFLARTPNLDWLQKNALYMKLNAHGVAVGMPTDDDMGNSEVGHNALGAGRIFDQGAKLVQEAIDDRRDLRERRLEGVTTGRARERRDVALHRAACPTATCTANIDHLMAMLQQRRRRGRHRRLRVHVLLDGRDVHETSGLIYVDRL